MGDFISLNLLSDLLGVSRSTVERWGATGRLRITTRGATQGFLLEDLRGIPIIDAMLHTPWQEEMATEPDRPYTSMELFAGAGGLALGLEMAGFHHVMLNELDHNACETLRVNRSHWNIVEGDVHHVDFTPYPGRVDLLTGGFPCQAFSYAGEKRGFEDARGTLFFELARAVREVNPRVFVGENVKGLLSHDGGRTLGVIKGVIADLGYTLVPPRVLKAILYQVPQKRERLFLVAIRNDLAGRVSFTFPAPYERVVTLRDALQRGLLYDCDVPSSPGLSYPSRKREIMALVPEGGNWKDLPETLQREYLKGSFLLGGGKTGIARRLSMDEPSLTLTCAPAMKQTERCHPHETRPLTVREYARIQIFPDNWLFRGSVASQYRQIGNAVPVNLAYAMGRALVRLLNAIERLES